MSRLRHQLLACFAAISLAAAAAWGAVEINDLQVTNVGTTAFTVVWTTSEVSTPGLEVFSDSVGTIAVTATLGLDYYPINEGDPAVVNDSGARAGRRALEMLAINRRVVVVRVTGLSPGTAYFLRPRTFAAAGADNGVGPVPLKPVTTALFTSMVVDGRLLRLRFPGFAGEGMIALVQGPAGTAPLAVIVGDSADADSAVLPLAGLLDTTSGTNALLGTSQQIVISLLGLGGPAGTFTRTVDFGSTFNPAKLATIELAIESPSPVFTAHPADRTALVDATATFTAAATGTPAPSYQWQRKPAASATWSNLVNDTVYAGATTGTLTVNNVTLAMSGDQFRCIASNGVPLDATSGAATLTVNPAPTTPTITTQPQENPTLLAGANFTLTAAATGSPAPTYQWQRNGTDIPGATASTLAIVGATQANAGVYVVVVSNVGGSATSSPTTLTVLERGLLNLLSRVTVPANGSVGGSFTIEGGSKSILIRGIGPSLALPGTLADPRLALLDAAGLTVATNDDWESNANSAAIATTGATLGSIPALGAGNKDAALLVTLAPGTYTADLAGAGGAGGLAQLEIVDADTGVWPRVAMLTMRGPVGSGANLLITGFSVSGTGSKTLLLRALGASLGAAHGVLRDPVLSVYASGATLLEQNNDSQVGNSATVSALNSAAVTAGVRTLGATADSALLLTLNPGAYTAQIAGFGGTTGESFLEIFEVDAQRAASFAPAITYLSRNQAAVPGGSASFGVNVVAKPAATFQWRKTVGGITTNLPGADGPLLTLTGVQPADAASYDVVISNGIGGAITSPARTLTLLLEFHSADTNRDHQISLLELTRVIQLFNFMNGATRTGEYHTQAGTEDGFALGPGSIAAYHSADTNRDGKIDAPELSRVIELYNFVNGTVRTGEYHPAVGTEDGFALGPGGLL